MSGDRRLAAVVLALALVSVAVVYLPDVGHGFLKDDFGWIASAERLASHPWAAFTADSSGTFYRPLITLSFAADYGLHGLQPFGYALTNLTLLISCAAAIVLLLRALDVPMAAAAVAAAVWLLNPHGINMSVMWLSGRTSLIMTLLSCLSIWALLRGRTAIGLVLFLGAMLSKEDALLLPLIVAACLWARRASAQRILTVSVLTLVPIAAYAGLRLRSNALTPASAPVFYRLTWDPALILENVVGYLDRSATAFAIVLVAAAAIYAAKPVIARERRRLLVVAAVWFAAGLAITVRVPVRSSLYAVFPSVGVALAFAVGIEAIRARTTRPQRDLVLQALFVVLLLAAPLYRSRNLRWVMAASVSRDTMAAVARERDRLPASGLVTFEDEPVRFANFQDALGEAATDAVRLALDRPLEGRIVPRGDQSTLASEAARFALKDGRVLRVR